MYFIFFWDLKAKVLHGLHYSLSNVTEHDFKAKEFSKSTISANEAYFVKLLIRKNVSPARAGASVSLFSVVSSALGHCLAHSKCSVKCKCVY